jgi:moderate conductance mechanosensitive channel
MIERAGAAAPFFSPLRRCLGILCIALLAATALPSGAGAASPRQQPAGEAAGQPIAELIKAIEDPGTRARLVEALRASEAAPRNAAPGAAGPGPDTAVPRLIHALGARLLDNLTNGINWFGDALRAVRDAVSDPSRALAAAKSRLASPEMREFASDVLPAFVVALAAGLAADLLVGWILAGNRRRAAARLPEGLVRRAAGSLALFTIDLGRVTALAVAAYAALAVFRPAPLTRLGVLALVNAVILDRAIRMTGRAILRPMHPALRSVRLGDETAAYLYIWVRRLTLVGVYGYVALEEALLLGLAPAVFSLGVKALGFVIAAMLVVFLMQNRRGVAEFLAPSPAVEPIGAWSALRRRAAGNWHVFALAYLIAVYTVWASEVPGGFAYLARASVLTALIVVVARGVAAAAQRGLTRLLHVNHELLARNPLVEARANRYVPVLRRAIGGAIWLAAGLAVLAAWRVDVAALLATPLVAEGVARLVAVAVVFAVALAVWEATDLVITMYLERKDDAGSAVIRSARIRTLLPLTRNAALVVILLFALLTALSQLGVNTAPLLAGAGVVGLAIGFGSQALVKDVITGAFILFEGTVNVGDVASINGTGGLVEAITIRTIRLRDLEGTVHTIPFGSVNTISNMTKDYSMYLLDIGVAYKENTDRVVEVMREVFADIVADPAYANDIIGDLEVLGVDRFADSAVYVRARIKTLPIRQWNVGREYNRRMKLKFDELGIEIPFPHRTIYFGQPAEIEVAGQTAGPTRALAAQSG